MNLWRSQNQKLDENLELNTRILKQMNLSKMERSLSRPLRAEYMNIVLTSLFIIYMLVLSVLLVDLVRFSIPGFIASVSASAVILFSIARVRGIHSINEFDISVLVRQKRYSDVTRMMIRLSKWDLFFGVLSALTMWPIILYTGFEVDVYEEVSWLLGFLGVCLVVILPVIYWFYGYYRKKMQDVNELLEELAELEKS